MVNQALAELTGEFQAMYAREGRPSIPPEKLLRALVLQILYTIRSVRLLMEQLDDNLLFRWFVGLSMDDKVWDHSVFSKNQERFLDSDLADAFFARIQQQAARAGLLSDDHFTVDGTLIEAWASLKSFRPKDGPPPAGGGGRNPEVDLEGQGPVGPCPLPQPLNALSRADKAGRKPRLVSPPKWGLGGGSGGRVGEPPLPRPRLKTFLPPHHTPPPAPGRCVARKNAPQSPPGPGPPGVGGVRRP
jgi:transposase